MSDLLDRQPPCDLAAERALLGSLFIKPDVMDTVAEIVTPEAFYDAANATLYRCMVRMFDDGGKIDIALVANALKATGELDRVGGTAALAKLTGEIPNAHHARYYAGIVRTKAQYRVIINDLIEVLKDAHAEQDKPTDLANRLQATSDVIEGNGDQHAAITAGDAALAAFRRANEIQQGARTGGIPIGLREFDLSIGGVFRGELTIIAARPTVGKSALGLQAAIAMAKDNEPTLFCSVEMSALELMSRALCAEAEVHNSFMRTGTLRQGDMDKLLEATNTFDDMPLVIDDRPNLCAGDVRRAARRVKRESGLSAVFVDYLSLLRIDEEERKLPRHEQVGNDCKRLKRLARELNIAVVCLAQVARKGDEKGDPPRLIHLKESGGIEENADMVIFLHRPELAKPHDRELQGKAKLIVAKNRQGTTGEFDLEFDKRATRFRDPVQAEEWNFDPVHGTEYDFG